ncbi:MAG: PssD/Cps14F family polysaccharide biosynthesis glycosyltransferase [Candidatus Kariarchaeaceae archaeon]|jgi:UDP-N-acetylglucosamine:LPS N-acetylglucosamine transferase
MKIALVCTHGGHLTETIQLLDAFEGHEVFFATHHSERDDDIQSIAPAYFSSSIGERPVQFIYTIFWALNILLHEKPDVIMSMGAEIALPFFFWSGFFSIKTIFIESWCRVESRSRTGRIAYWLADEFWVQWESLLPIYGSKAQYKGQII